MYQVSNLGRVKSLCDWSGNKFVKQYKNREKILKIKPKKQGYCVVTLRHKNKIKYKTVHRLVAETFIPNPNNYPVVNHKDGNKSNNKLENLEWCTYSYNSKHAIKNGLNKLPPNTRKGKFGKEHNKSKKVYQIKDGKIINVFYGVADASRKTGISKYSIYAVVTHRRNTAGKFKWRYVNE